MLLVEFWIDFVQLCGATLLIYLMMCLDCGFGCFLVCFEWKVRVIVACFA